jgi:hypothetical protein
MEMQLLNLREPEVAFSYARTLRCVGQALDDLSLKAFQVKLQNDVYEVQAWQKGIYSAPEIELRYTAEDLKRLEHEGRRKRRHPPKRTNFFTVSQLLRLAGNYLDRVEGRLVKISWQKQADRIQSVTLQYEPIEEQRKEEKPSATIEEICLHIYRQKKRLASLP